MTIAKFVRVILLDESRAIIISMTALGGQSSRKQYWYYVFCFVSKKKSLPKQQGVGLSQVSSSRQVNLSEPLGYILCFASHVKLQTESMLNPFVHDILPKSGAEILLHIFTKYILWLL